jgi:hypothetical protein
LGLIHGAPLVSTETGFDGYIETYMNWADAHGVSYLAWTWDAWGSSHPESLITDYTGTPTRPYGSGYQQHLAALAGAAPLTPQQGAAIDIATGANGSVWAVGTKPVAGGYGIWRWTGSSWASVPGGAITIAVDPNGNPWVANSAHRIYHWNGQSWDLYPGLANDLSVGANGSVWAVGTTPVAGGYGIWRWPGSSWASAPGGAVTIAVGPNGNLWVINFAHRIFAS